MLVDCIFLAVRGMFDNMKLPSDAGEKSKKRRLHLGHEFIGSRVCCVDFLPSP